MKLLDYLLTVCEDQPASLKYGKIVEVWFAIGCHGLQWEDTRVTDCKMQARLHGVHKGWMILAVNGMEVTSAKEVEAYLSDACIGGMPYPIVFVTDPTLVRAAEAKRKTQLKEKIIKALQRRDNEGRENVSTESTRQRFRNSVRAARSWARKEERLKRIYTMCNKDGGVGVSKEELISICTVNKGVAAFFGIPTNLGGEELDAALENFFEAADADGDGEMTWEEFRDFCKSQEEEGTTEKMKKKWKTTSLAHSSLREKRLHDIFEKCDTGASGEISKNNLLMAIRKDEAIAEFFNLPKKFKKPEEIQALKDFARRVDSNGDGQLTWQEFLEFDKNRQRQQQVSAAQTQRRLSRLERKNSKDNTATPPRPGSRLSMTSTPEPHTNDTQQGTPNVDQRPHDQIVDQTITGIQSAREERTLSSWHQ